MARSRFCNIFCISFIFFAVVYFFVPIRVVLGEEEVDLSKGLVGYWNFDEDDNSGAVVYDHSRSGNNGILVNNPTRESGKIGRAMRFDGTSYMVTEKRIGILGKEATISFWMKASKVSSYSNPACVIFELSSNFNNSEAFAISFNDNSAGTNSGPIGSIVIGMHSAKGYSIYTTSEGHRYDDDTWHHIIVIFDRSKTSLSEQTNLYIDNVIAEKRLVYPHNSVQTTSFSDDNIYIGRRLGLPTFPGLIDEVRIYNRALSIDEVNALGKQHMPDSLSITLSEPKKNSITSYVPILFTLKTTLPKVSEGTTFKNRTRIRMVNAFIPLRYDHMEENGMTIWRGTYNRPNGIVGPFHLSGTLESVNCQNDTGTKLAFDIDDLTFGTTVIQKVEKNGIFENEQVFTPLYPPDPSKEDHSFLSHPILFLLDYIGFSHDESKLEEQTIETKTTYVDEKEMEEKEKERTNAELRSWCGKQPKEIFICGTSNVLDADGNVYGTVQVGTQCWMNKNMNVGNMLPIATMPMNNGIIEKWCYRNDINNCSNNGGFYILTEAMQYSSLEGVQGICPLGFHIPTNADAYVLEKYLSDPNRICSFLTSEREEQCFIDSAKLFSGGSSGLNFKPVAWMISWSSWNNNDYGTGFMFFTSSNALGTNAWVRQFDAGTGVQGRFVISRQLNRWVATSVRCLKD